MEESLLHVCALGPALVIVTQGEKGVLARSGSSDTLQVPTFPVAVIDTVGAGDAFCAGVLAWLVDEGFTSRERVLALSEQELRSALSFASAVAALNCTRVGANPPRRSEVAQFLQGGCLKSL
jgi:fructokinase